MTRDYVQIYLNGKSHDIRGNEAVMNLSDWLRYQKRLTGTKVVCAEGDCGACTVLKGDPRDCDEQGRMHLRPLNSCIAPVALFDGCAIVTVEALAVGKELHPVQKAMQSCHGSQCGYCTPGFVMAIAGMHEQVSAKDCNMQRVKNNLTGNLCRCTGYQQIIDAAMSVKRNEEKLLRQRFDDESAKNILIASRSSSFAVGDENWQLVSPVTRSEALDLIQQDPKIRVIAGSTDLGVQRNKGRLEQKKFMTLSRIPDFYDLSEKGGRIFVGAAVNLRRLEDLLSQRLPRLADFMHIFASPQIKENATIVGNLANGSPVGDTLPGLLVLDSQVHLASTDGDRIVPIERFYLGYKQMDIKPGELITGMSLAIPDLDYCRFYKISQRRDLDISAVNAAVRLKVAGGKVSTFKVAYGGVAPYPLRLPKTESIAVGQTVDSKLVETLAMSVRSEVSPISDVRGGQAYRLKLTENIMRRFFDDYSIGKEQ